MVQTLVVIQYRLSPAGKVGTKKRLTSEKAPIIRYCWLPPPVGEERIVTSVETAIEAAKRTIRITVSAPCGFSITELMNNQPASPVDLTSSSKLSPRSRRKSEKKIGSCRSRGRQDARGLTLFSL